MLKFPLISTQMIKQFFIALPIASLLFTALLMQYPHEFISSIYIPLLLVKTLIFLGCWWAYLNQPSYSGSASILLLNIDLLVLIFLINTL